MAISINAHQAKRGTITGLARQRRKNSPVARKTEPVRRIPTPDPPTAVGMIAACFDLAEASSGVVTFRSLVGLLTARP